jgi:hypothetical protein
MRKLGSLLLVRRLIYIFNTLSSPKIETESTNEASLFELLKANDIFSAGCIVAQLYLTSPLFTKSTLRAYKLHNVLPAKIHEVGNNLLKVTNRF